VFALGRRALGRACAKPVPVSVVGIFSCDGVEVMTVCQLHCVIMCVILRFRLLLFKSQIAFANAVLLILRAHIE